MLADSKCLKSWDSVTRLQHQYLLYTVIHMCRFPCVCVVCRTVMCSNGLERHFFLAPDGSSYSGRKQAVEYMKKISASQQDIRKMESGFKVRLNPSCFI